MANRWCDGFGRYGGDEAKMLNGSSSQAWAEVSGNAALSTEFPRTGTHSLRIPLDPVDSTARRVFGAPLENVYIGFALRCTTLPNTEPTPGGTLAGIAVASFRSASNVAQFSIILGTDGALVIYRAGYWSAGNFIGTLIHRTDPLIGAGAFQHIEIYASASETDGAIEVRVDEITRISLTGINTVASGSPEFSQIVFQRGGNGSMTGADYDFADVYVNDTVNDGSGCHTFIGDCKSGWLPVNADTAQADFTLSAGTDGFALLDDTPPDDGTYISTSSSTAESDFGLTDGPANLSEILTVRPAVRAQKDDAGSALIAPSMKSNSVKAAIDGQPITTAFAYYDANVPFNPDTDAPWTLSELDAALHVVERVE